jgi:hypothetical protein
VSDALSNVGRIGDMALDAVLIYAVFRLTYVVWRLQRAIRVGTSKLETFLPKSKRCAPASTAWKRSIKTVHGDERV